MLNDNERSLEISKMASKRKEMESVILKVALDELSDSSEINMYDPVVEEVAKRLKRRAIFLGTARIEDYVEITVPTYSDPLFRAHFRMTRASFQVIWGNIPHTIHKCPNLVLTPSPPDPSPFRLNCNQALDRMGDCGSDALFFYRIY